MLRALLRQDLRLLWRERSLQLVTLLIVTSVLYATFSGSAWKNRQLEELRSAQGELATIFEQQLTQLEGLESGELSVQQAAAAGLPNTVKTIFIKAPGPLAELAIGSADLRPRKAEISALGRADDMFRFYEIDNPALLAMGRFDLAFVVVYLMPLLILGLTYSVLSADRESGALGLLLAQPITAGQLAWARIILRSVVVTMVVVLGTIAGWSLFASASASPQAWSRLLMWSGVVLIYAGFWASLAALVAARNRGSDSNALLLLIAWVLITLLLPAAVTITAQTLNPTPSRMEYITAARAAENDANARGRQLLKGYLMDHPEIEAVTNSSVAPYIKTFVLVQQQVESATAPITDAFEEKLEAQLRLANMLAYLSPASLTQRALSELAGTSLERQRRFEKNAKDLRQNWFAALEPPLIAGRRLSSNEFSALARPEFTETSVAATVRAIAAPLVLMLFYTAMVARLAIGRFRRFSLGG